MTYSGKSSKRRVNSWVTKFMHINFIFLATEHLRYSHKRPVITEVGFGWQESPWSALIKECSSKQKHAEVPSIAPVWQIVNGSIWENEMARATEKVIKGSEGPDKNAVYMMLFGSVG